MTPLYTAATTLEHIARYCSDNYLEVAGAFIGLLYLYLEYKASSLLWIVGIIMPAIYIFVYYDAGLYADFGISIYYVIAAIYGWAVWTLGKRKDGGRPYLPITHTPRCLILPLALVFALLWAACGLILTHYTDSTVPWSDAFTTALSVVGMWLLARKHLEQWLAWILVDAVSVVLYIYKELYFTTALYALYTVIAILGYRKWKQLMHSASYPHTKP